MYDNFGYISLFFFGLSILFFIFAAISRRQGDQGTDSAQITIALILLAISILTFLVTLASNTFLKPDDSNLYQPIKFFITFIT